MTKNTDDSTTYDAGDVRDVEAASGGEAAASCLSRNPQCVRTVYRYQFHAAVRELARVSAESGERVNAELVCLWKRSTATCR